METDQEKNDIIELTEVVEEGSALSGGRELQSRMEPRGEKKQENSAGNPPGDSVSRPYDLSLQAMKKSMASQVETWTAGEGGQIIGRLAEELIPRLTRERLSPEIEKVKSEIAALRAQRESLADLLEKWFQKEGAEAIERMAREAIPRIAAGELNRQVEELQKEREGLRAEREALARKQEEWFQTEGTKLLEERAGEAIPRLVGEALEPKLEALKSQMEKAKAEREEWNRQATLWFEKEGRQIVENTVREIFPPIAEKVLRQEIEKLREETEEND